LDYFTNVVGEVGGDGGVDGGEEEGHGGRGRGIEVVVVEKTQA